MKPELITNDIFNLHQDCITKWKAHGVSLQHENILRLIEENHSFNFQLWHAEDRARRDDRGYEFVYKAKREIDGFNQQRNNRMEMIDSWFYEAIQPCESTDCPTHSETPGMMVDRLSILALKSYHMAEQANRQDVDCEHKKKCEQKLFIIERQRQHLLHCLQNLIAEAINKTRTFRVYHQFKMYNDPNLNPELYENK